MPSLVRTTARHLVTAAALALAACGGAHPPAPPASPPVVAALDTAGLPAAVRGRVLLGELGCVACHDRGARDVDAPAGPDLRTAGTRVDANYLRDFLLAPHATEPGTVMPDLLQRWPDAARRERADALAHFVRSLAASAPPPTATTTPPDSAARERGAALYRRIGCVQCHEPTPAAPLGRKYTQASLQAFLLAPHTARPSGRMPDFALSPSEADDLAAFLRTPAPSAPAATVDASASAPEPLDPQRVAAGRALFAELQCARCHDLGPEVALPALPVAKPLTALDPTRGCLAEQPGAAPHYALTSAQRADLRAALAEDAPPPDAEQQILQRLAQSRCFACHQRDAHGPPGGSDLERFGTDDPNLGDEARRPPPLTGVGARLQRDWLQRAIAHGQRERPYLHVRMPGFGAAVAADLTARFAAVDTLPAVVITPLRGDHEADKPVLELGRALVGEKGFSCITCHRFAGEQIGTMGAIDLVATTGQRLRPEWFAHFLRDPFRWKPNTVMPHFFPGGASTRPEFAGGDVQQQIDALWHYLAEGRNVRAPDGLRQLPIELVVGSEAVVLRRAVQGAGKRGIAIGLPGGVNATFDAEQLGLNQIWWGRFVDARPIWTNQGSGQAHLLSRDVIALPNGPALARLPTPTAPWPVTTRRERGDRWLGYDLDGKRRPTLRYTADGVTVADALAEVTGDGKPTRLRRTWTLKGGPGVWTLRAARHAQLRLVDATTASVGARLLLRCGDAPMTVVAVDGQDEPELRLTITLRDAPVVVTLEYGEAVEQGK